MCLCRVSRSYVVTGMLGVSMSYHRQLSHKSFRTPKVGIAAAAALVRLHAATSCILLPAEVQPSNSSASTALDAQRSS
jgi:hypothetical protein